MGGLYRDTDFRVRIAENGRNQKLEGRGRLENSGEQGMGFAHLNSLLRALGLQGPMCPRLLPSSRDHLSSWPSASTERKLTKYLVTPVSFKCPSLQTQKENLQSLCILQVVMTEPPLGPTTVSGVRWGGHRGCPGSEGVGSGWNKCVHWGILPWRGRAPLPPLDGSLGVGKVEGRPGSPEV